jgi:hypothetical protein
MPVYQELPVTTRPKTYRMGLPLPDASGRWRPAVGRTVDGKAARFQVGSRNTTSEAEALKRLNAIRDLYNRQCRELGLDYWAGWVQAWAMKLSHEVPVVVHASSAALTSNGQAAEELAIVRQLQAWGAPIAIADSQLPAIGYAHIRQRIEEEVARAVQQAVADVKQSWGDDLVEETEQQTGLPADPKTAPRGTLHGTLDNFKTHLERTGKQDAKGNLAQHVRKVLEWIETLRLHHSNFQLWQLDFGMVDRMVAYWRNRPTTKRGDRCSIDYARMMIQTMYRYLRWLDRQVKHRWTMPKGADDIPRAPIRLPEDDGKHQTAFRSTTKHTYTPEQLAIIAHHTDEYGRALVGVCVNCAFGAAEVGQWRVSDYHLFARHPHAADLGITSDDTDSWVVGRRPKTGIYGEHLLWDEVARAVQPWLNDGREVLTVTASTGKPWFRPEHGNAQTYFGSWWRLLLNRVVKEHERFPLLPFGSLRDLLPDVLRREYSDEVASLALQHGKLSSDDLLHCYTNLPFRKLFEATRELRTMFKPFLDALQARPASTPQS